VHQYNKSADTVGRVWPGAGVILALVLAVPALAATGDALVVLGDGVNVRAGPSGDAAVRMRVHRDQQVIELQREGRWVRAEIAGTDGQEGWIHSSLLGLPGGEPAPEEDAAAAELAEPAEQAEAAPQRPSVDAVVPHLVEPAAGPVRGLGELAQFRDTVSYLNRRALALAGADLFAEVKPGPGGVMRVVATDNWSSLPPAGRQSYANTLLDRWAAAKVSAGPVVLQILDPSGEVVMEKSQP
jgi:pyruvate/2-oxoglutarate dehydrogenase complex dihydrolipoamide acyltransferase (E2) component